MCDNSAGFQVPLPLPGRGQGWGTHINRCRGLHPPPTPPTQGRGDPAQEGNPMQGTVIRTLLAAVLAAATSVNSGAQTYPSKPVKVIVPNTAGSGVDIVGRAVSQRLQESFSQPFVVENRPGAGTTTGIAAAAVSP